MKNSLFKRAVATVATVPLALTQCLTVAITTSTVAADSNKTLTLDRGVESSILYIAPDELDNAYVQGDGIWTKESEWNYDVHGMLSNIAGGANAKGTFDLTTAREKAINNSGEFEEVTKALCDKLSDAEYSVAKNGDVTVKITLDDITPTFTEGGKKTVGGALKDIAAEYGVEDLEEPGDFFDGLVIAGELTIKVAGSALQDGTEVSGEVSFKDAATGKVYTGTGIIDWALAQFDTLKAKANETCAKYEAEYGIDMNEASKKIDDSVSFYVDKLEKAKDYVDKALGYENKSYSYDTMAEAYTAAKKQFDKRNTTNKKINSNSVTELVATDIFVNNFEDILGQLNDKAAPDKIDLTAEEIGVFAEGLTDIQVTVNAGVATFHAKAVDAEKDAVVEYIQANYPVEVIDSYKVVDVTVDFSDCKGGTGSADMTIAREVIVEEIETTTTEATTTEATTTEETTTEATTTSEDETTTTEAETTTSEEETTTTEAETTTSEDETTTTEAETTTSEDETTTTEAETTTTDEEETTTASTTDEEEETTTTTVTDDNGYIVVETTVVNFQCESGVGFYLTLDEEFNAGQVDKLTYTIDRVIAHIDEEGNVVEQEFIEGSDPVDITDMVAFEGTPGDAYMATNTTFKYEIPIVAAETIKAEDGAVIATAGQPFNQPSGAQVLITTYIGLKGDGNLNNRLDTSDASFTLKWYSIVSTMEDGKVPADYKFSESDLVTSNTDVIDDFALFLCDINNFDAENNYKLTKNARAFTTTEASRILKAYSYASTTNDPNFSLAKWDWAEIE